MRQQIIYFFSHSWYLQWALLGAVAATAFITPLLWWVILIVIFRGLHLTRRPNELTHGKIIGAGILFGSLYYFGAIAWKWSAYPLEWMGLHPLASFALIFLYVLLGVLFLSVGKVVMLYLIRYTPRCSLFFFPIWWLVGEVVSAYTFSVHVVGSNSSINGDFAFGMVGFLLAEHDVLLTAASLGGVYALSLLYVTLGVTCYIIWSSGIRKSGLYAAVIGVVIVFSSLINIPNRPIDSTLSVATIETSFPRRDEVTADQRRIEADSIAQSVVQAIQAGNEYVILPEDSRFARNFANEREALDFLKSVAPHDVVVVDTGTVTIDGAMYVRAFIFDTKTDQMYQVDKQYLVPHGEYIPYFHSTLLRWLGQGQMIDDYTDRFDYGPGPLIDQAHLPNHIPSILFCYESTSPTALWKLANTRNEPFVAHPVSLAFFTNPSVLQHQLDQMLRVNTTFAGVDVYQAGNMTRSDRY